jgi:hypothetical protein
METELPMTESNRSTEELPALIAERRKYEGWLAALEARREATAPHVFDRVRADYTSRLRGVEEQLAAHRTTILDERTSLQSRRSLLEAEEQMRRDERAELELRAHVGELAGEEAEIAFSTVDEALAKMGLEKDGLTKRIDELDGLLNLPGGAAPAESPQGTEPVAESSVGVDAAEAVAPRAPTPASAQPAAAGTAEATPGVPTPPSVAAAATDAPAVAESPADDADEQLVLSEHSATFQRTSGTMPDMDQVLSNPPGQRQPRLTPGGRFDELAFLSDVVGLKTDGSAPEASAMKEEPVKSPLDGMAPTRPSTVTPPLASNVGNTPIVLRASGAISQSKTLKCTECGAMNYPTEWYCERCGAELAAL